MRTFTQGNGHDIILKDEFKNYIFEITATSLRGQWVKSNHELKSHNSSQTLTVYGKACENNDSAVFNGDN